MFTTKLQSNDWYAALGDKLSKVEQLLLLTQPDTEILSAISLEMACGKKAAKTLISEAGIHPEIDFDGMRRCIYMSTTGVRCCGYGELPICKKHERAAMSNLMNFKSEKLRHRYERELKNPRKMQLGSELAMMRTMLGAMVDKLTDSGEIPLEYIGAITSMCEKISGVVDKMSKMNTITPEHIDNILNKTVEIIARFVPADKMVEIADEIAKLDPTKMDSDIQFMPGETLEAVDGARLIELEPPHAPMVKRELVEMADRLGLETGEG